MCQFETPLFIIYSYIAVIVLSLITAFSILAKNTKHSLNRNAFYFIMIVSLWTIGDLAQWLSHDREINFFFFRLSYLLDFFFLFFLYFSYDFVNEKINKTKKIFFALPFLVTIFSIISKNGIGNVEPVACDYSLGWLIYYSLFMDLIYAVWASIVLIKRYKDPVLAYKTKMQIRILVFTIMSFVLWSIAYELVDVFRIAEKININISPYFILGNLFFIALMIFNIIEYELFDCNFIPVKWFAFTVVSLVFLGMFFLSLTPMFYLILLIFYIAVIWVFWGK